MAELVRAARGVLLDFTAGSVAAEAASAWSHRADGLHEALRAWF